MKISRNNVNSVAINDKKLKMNFKYALEIASGSEVPNPEFSQYFVKCAALLIDDNKWPYVHASIASIPGGNMEYGLCQALHGEESLVAAMRSDFVRRFHIKEIHKRLVVIAFSSNAHKDNSVATCCGNCRDIMRDYLPENSFILSGHPNGGIASVIQLSDLLVDEFTCIINSNPAINDVIQETIFKGLRIQNNIYSGYGPHPRRRYIACIVGRDNSLFIGAHDVMCDYHPIYALRDAVRQVRRSSSPYFKYAVIIGKDDGTGLPPDVMYRDRQHLLELNFQQNCLSGENNNPKVILATYKLSCDGKKVELTNQWQTSINDWLPYPFNPAAFGDDFVKFATDSFKLKMIP